MNVYEEIIEEIKKRNITSQKKLNKLKIEFARKKKIVIFPTNIDILNHATSADRILLKHILFPLFPCFRKVQDSQEAF